MNRAEFIAAVAALPPVKINNLAVETRAHIGATIADPDLIRLWITAEVMINGVAYGQTVSPLGPIEEIPPALVRLAQAAAVSALRQQLELLWGTTEAAERSPGGTKRWLLTGAGTQLHYPVAIGVRRRVGGEMRTVTEWVAACRRSSLLSPERTDDHDRHGISHERCGSCVRIGFQ